MELATAVNNPSHSLFMLSFWELFYKASPEEELQSSFVVQIIHTPEYIADPRLQDLNPVSVGLTYFNFGQDWRWWQSHLTFLAHGIIGYSSPVRRTISISECGSIIERWRREGTLCDSVTELFGLGNDNDEQIEETGLIQQIRCKISAIE